MGLQEGPALAQAISASRSDLASPITCAPLALSAFIVSNPIPELQPVTTMRLPVRSMPASTLSAVERAPNGVDLTIRNTSLPGLIQRRAEHARRDRHPLDEFFSRYRTLLEAARRGMQRARQIRRRQPGRSAKPVHRRIPAPPANHEFDLTLGPAGRAGHFIHRWLTISIAGKDPYSGLQHSRLARVGGFCFRGLRYAHPDRVDNVVLLCQVSRPNRDSRKLRWL